MSRNLMVVFTNTEPGKDDEFNRWYDDIHVGEVLSVPEMKACTRYKVVDDNAEHRYLALYEFEGDPDAVMASMLERGGPVRHDRPARGRPPDAPGRADQRPGGKRVAPQIPRSNPPTRSLQACSVTRRREPAFEIRFRVWVWRAARTAAPGRLRGNESRRQAAQNRE